MELYRAPIGRTRERVDQDNSGQGLVRLLPDLRSGVAGLRWVIRWVMEAGRFRRSAITDPLHQRTGNDALGCRDSNRWPGNVWCRRIPSLAPAGPDSLQRVEGGHRWALRGMFQKGGFRTYMGRLGKDRSPGESRHSIYDPFLGCVGDHKPTRPSLSLRSRSRIASCLSFSPPEGSCFVAHWTLSCSLRSAKFGSSANSCEGKFGMRRTTGGLILSGAILIEAAVREFARGRSQFDDITCLALRR